MVRCWSLACATSGAFATESVTDFVAVAQFTLSVGVNVACNVCALPACSTVPAAGVYVNVPGTLAVALSCVDESAVP